jgi:hypothetical protein
LVILSSIPLVLGGGGGRRGGWVSETLIMKYCWNCDSKDGKMGRKFSRHGSNEIGIINYVMKI